MPKRRPPGATNLVMGSSAKNASFVLTETGTFEKGGFAIKATGITAVPGRPGDFSTLALDQLEPMEVLGSGACGTVRLARHVPTGRLVALKAINVMADQGQRHQVTNELRVLCRFDHPHLVPLFDAFYLEGNIYLALGYMNGGSLEQLLTSYQEVASRGVQRLFGIPEDVLALLTLQMVCGLHHLHAHGVVHRDLKPANVLIDTNGVTKVADFGISKQLEATFGAQAPYGLDTPAPLRSPMMTLMVVTRRRL